MPYYDDDIMEDTEILKVYLSDIAEKARQIRAKHGNTPFVFPQRKRHCDGFYKFRLWSPRTFGGEVI